MTMKWAELLNYLNTAHVAEPAHTPTTAAAEYTMGAKHNNLANFDWTVRSLLEIVADLK